MNHINRLTIKNKNEGHVDQAHKQVDIDLRSIVIGDMKNFIHSLLSHAEENNCPHCDMDLQDEFFDNKKMSGVTQPSTHKQPTSQFSVIRFRLTGGDEL